MSAVPCNGCIACCKHDLIVIHPEEGDDASTYETMQVINPITGAPALALKRQANGWCIYLTEGGCSIHGRAPAICREFDCRLAFLKLGGRTQRRQLLKAGMISKDVLDAGRKRMDTLTGFEV